MVERDTLPHFSVTLVPLPSIWKVSEEFILIPLHSIACPVCQFSHPIIIAYLSRLCERACHGVQYLWLEITRINGTLNPLPTKQSCQVPQQSINSKVGEGVNDNELVFEFSFAGKQTCRVQWTAWYVYCAFIYRMGLLWLLQGIVCTQWLWFIWKQFRY